MNARTKEPVPVPDVFDGQTLSLSSVAEQIAVLAEYEDLSSAIRRFVSVKAGNAIALPSTLNEHIQLLYVTPENLMFIAAALASHSRLRSRFVNFVTTLLEEGRKTSEYQEMLAAREQLLDQIRRIDEALKEMDEASVFPFSLSDVMQSTSTDSVKTTGKSGISRQSRRGERTRSRGAHKYSLSEYVFPRRVNGRLFYLRRGYAEIVTPNGKVAGEYHVADEYGNIYAVGNTFAEADRRWHESRGMSPNISTPREWDVAEQERRAEAGQEYHVR